MPHVSPIILCSLLAFSVVAPAADPTPGAIPRWLAEPLLDDDQIVRELQAFLEPKVARLPELTTAEAWEQEARRLRQAVLDRVIYQGAARQWRDEPTQVEWLETIPGGAGYQIRKLRFQAVPGLWIPALLYEPERVEGRVPIVVNVNGHDGKGKAADYKQTRCINFAKRGMLALNVEWLGMGQLRVAGLAHGRMNQLDLCGTSGLAPFYESLRRSIDVALQHPQADPARVAVAGLSGGGWQTILISSLDERVTLSNPVAGYSSFRTRIHHFSDLGDSEQTPVDLGAVADYSHLTALLAPRPALLTYNVQDNCCFASGHALPPLLEASLPCYRLFGQDSRLRSHVNYAPGTHNFDRDNREALYRMIADHFYRGRARPPVEEIECASEIQTEEQLRVPLPESNATFQSLAWGLSEHLPRPAAWPAELEDMEAWRRARVEELRKRVAVREMTVEAQELPAHMEGDTAVCPWILRLDESWSVPVVEFRRGAPARSVLLLHDQGKKEAGKLVESLLGEGYRVYACDPCFTGELAPRQRAYLWALLVSTVGERPLGLAAAQIAAVAKWVQARDPGQPLIVRAEGERCGLSCLVAAASLPAAIPHVQCRGGLGSLRQVLQEDRSFEQSPELFCFGLLESFDVMHLAALIAPRPVEFLEPSERIRGELSGLGGWYERLGTTFQPLR